MGIIWLFCLLLTFGIVGCLVLLYVRHLYFSNVLLRIKNERKVTSNDPDVVIIGAGLAGSAMATMLCRDGRKVVLIDKNVEPQETMAGQSWMAGGVQAIKDLGLDSEVNSKSVDGFLIKDLSIHGDGEVLALTSGFENLMANNKKAVAVFRSIALAESNCIFIAGKVKRFLKKNDSIIGVEYVPNENVDDLKALKAPLTIVADGKNSWFRQVIMTLKPKPTVYGIGFGMPKFIPKYEDKLVGVPSTKGPVFNFRVNKTHSSFVHLLSEPHDKHLLEKLASEFPECMRSMYLETLAKQTKLDRATGMYLPAVGNCVPGVIAIGDAYSMRDPITASGMNMAMRDIKTWRELLRDIPDLADYDVMYAAQNVFCIQRKTYSLVNDVGAHFFYHVMAPKTDGTKILGVGYGDYIGKLTPDKRRIVQSLFDQSERRLWLLLYYMYAVLFHSMALAVKSGGLTGFSKSFSAFKAFHGFLLPHLWYELLSSYAPRAKPRM